MTGSGIGLKEVDSVDVTIVLDGVCDLLLASTETVKRVPLKPVFGRTILRAEHGFSAVVRVSGDGASQALMFDAGISRDGLAYNLDVLEIKANELAAIVLSHGHADHTTGLLGLMRRLGARRMPLVLHPDALLMRKVVFPDGHEMSLPPPNPRVLRHDNVELIEEREPSCLLGGGVLVTGQIHRSTDFERGFPIHWARHGRKWEPDPLIHDDQAVVVNVRDKGLVILTGCGHAGVINTIRHAQALTGVEKVHAVIGGFHLSGPIFEPVIAPTVAALREFALRMIVPGHCTGWRATHAIAHELPEAFVQTSVGTRFVI